MTGDQQKHPAPKKFAEEQIRIIPAVDDEDLARIADLAAAIWRVHYPGIISPAQIEYMLARMYSLATLREEIHARQIRFYQLLAEEQTAGFASVGPAGAPRVFKLHKLYVAPETHGHGLGWRLLRHCEQEATNLGATRLILAVNKLNTKALAFYQRNGFSIIEWVVNDIGGGFVMDDFIMAKELE